MMVLLKVHHAVTLLAGLGWGWYRADLLRLAGDHAMGVTAKRKIKIT